MESVELATKNLRELVTKFSHASCILVYYGYFYHCEKMMKLLCKDTLRVWTKNECAFKNSILSQLKTIEYRNQFDSDFCNYLLKIDQKYGRIPFKINVMLIERFSYDEFLTNFLKNVQEIDKLMFNSILWVFKLDLLPEFIKVYDKLKEIGVDDGVFEVTEDFHYRINILSKKMELGCIPFLPALPNIKLWKFCNKAEIAEIGFSKEVQNGILSEINIPIKHLKFVNDEAFDELLNPGFELNKELK